MVIVRFYDEFKYFRNPLMAALEIVKYFGLSIDTVENIENQILKNRELVHIDLSICVINLLISPLM